MAKNTKKDFSSINTEPLYESISEATSAPEEEPATDTAAEPTNNSNVMPGQLALEEVFEIANMLTHAAKAETTPARKDRKTYSYRETMEALANMKTAGKKGMQLPRINMAFTPENNDFIRTMSKVSGLNFTQFVNRIIEEYRQTENNKKLYEIAKKFRDSI